MERHPTTTHQVSRTRLVPLLRAAAHTPYDDPDWELLRADARATTVALAARGVLPHDLVVETRDPPVVVARTLGLAWRHVATLDPLPRPADVVLTGRSPEYGAAAS